MDLCLELRSAGPIPRARSPIEIRAFGTVRARPQRVAFRAERFEIPNPERWRLYSVMVGNVEQLTREQRDNGYPADLFTRALYAFTTCQVAMEFVMVVAYIGSHPDGEVFECEVRGAVAR
jgi:hypothetical protein